MPEPSVDALVADLRAFGPVGAPTSAEVASLADAVTARVADLPAPARRAGRPSPRARLVAAVAARRRRLAVAVVVVVIALTGVPAVRAAVADWFGFAGVRVRLSPGPGPTVAPPPPTAAPGGSLDRVGSLVAFAPLVPAVLGPPDGVEVSADRRVLSMSWHDPAAGVVRLDEFDGGLDYTFAKTAPEATFTSVDGDFALWFERPHEVAWLAGGRDGQTRRQPPRTAGRTLIWEHDGTALRLEGDLTLSRAREIAESVRNP